MTTGAYFEVGEGRSLERQVFTQKHLSGFLTKNHQWELTPDVGEPVHQERCDDATDVTHGGADEDTKIPGTQGMGLPF